MSQDKKCCIETKSDIEKGIFSGILYGLIPHSFCLAFALFSIIGAITASVFLKKVLLVPNIFMYLILVSVILATVSVIIYLKRGNNLCSSGIKCNWKYISIIYTTTIVINLAFFYGVIPALANINISKIVNNQQSVSEVSLKVSIPCTGHSFLIIDEVRKLDGIIDVKFKAPDVFIVKYDNITVTPEYIESQEIFKTFKATII